MAFPTVDIAEAQLFSNNPVLVTNSLSGYEQRAVVSTQKFELVARYSNLSTLERRLIQSFIQEQQGALNSFDIALPGELGDSSAGFSGTIQTAALGSVGESTVSISSSNSTAVLKKGDLIRFTGKTKLYTVTADLTTDAGGTGTLSISPALITSVAGTTTIIHTGVSLNARFKNTQNSWSVNQTQYANLTLEFIEVF